MARLDDPVYHDGVGWVGAILLILAFIISFGLMLSGLSGIFGEPHYPPDASAIQVTQLAVQRQLETTHGLGRILLGALLLACILFGFLMRRVGVMARLLRLQVELSMQHQPESRSPSSRPLPVPTPANPESEAALVALAVAQEAAAARAFHQHR